jgi:hypothetical protein
MPDVVVVDFGAKPTTLSNTSKVSEIPEKL